MAKRKQRFHKEDQQELLDMLVKKVYKQGISDIQEQVQKGKDQGKTSQEINITIADAQTWRNAHLRRGSISSTNSREGIFSYHQARTELT